MKSFKKVVLSLSGLGILAIWPLLIGCETFERAGGAPPSSMTNQPSQAALSGPIRISDEIQPGEGLTVEFRDVAPEQAIQTTVREDGTITLLLNQSVKAAGMRKGELEKTIYEMY